jgi:hypothetical protein
MNGILRDEVMNGIVRDEVASDLCENYPTFSLYPSVHNRQEINCGACGRAYYTDKVNYETWLRAIEQGIDNPFVCDDCQLEENDLAYAER